MQEMQEMLKSQEDPLEKEMATHSSILAWEIPRVEYPGGWHPWGCIYFSRREKKKAGEAPAELKLLL